MIGSASNFGMAALGRKPHWGDEEEAESGEGACTYACNRGYR